MKQFIINHKSRWLTSLAATLLIAAASILLVFPQQEKASVTPLFPTYTTGSFTFSSPLELTANYGTFKAADSEPEIKIDIFGNIYITATQGVAAGTDLWKSIDRGASFVYLGQPDGAQDHCTMLPQCIAGGGGDDSIAVSSDGYLYVSSLWLGSVTMSASYDGGTGGTLPGQKWEVNPAAATIPGDDRQWIAAYGPQTVYMSYTDIGTGVIDFEKSTDGGKTFGPPVQTYPVTSAILSDVQGNMAVDQYNGNIYICFVPLGADNQVYINRSTDGGSTWTLLQAYNGPAGTSNAQVFPTMALDRGGNVYVAFSQCDAVGHTNCQIQMVSSADAGNTWQSAYRVSNGSATATAVEPTIAAGSPGIVDVTWLGSSASTPDVASDWHVFFAQVANANTGSPTIAQNQAEANVMHKWDICFNGTGCANNAHQSPGNRDLFEYYSMAIDEDGNANIVYTDSVTDCPDATCITNEWVVKQTTGPRAYNPPAPPAPATFAANLALPGSGGAAEPSLVVDSHNCIYGSAPGTYFFRSTDGGVTFSAPPPPPVLGGGDEDVATIRLQTGARNDSLYYADLALADVGIYKSTDRGTTWTSPGTGGVAGNFDVSSDRQWIWGDRINNGANQILWELDHEFTTEEIRISASIDDSPWGTTAAEVDPTLNVGSTPNTNPGRVFVDYTTHNMHGVFAASNPTTNGIEGGFGKEPDYWEVVASPPPAGGLPPANVANYPIVKGLIDSPSTAIAGTTTYGTHIGAIFPAAAADSAGNIYAVWSTCSARANASIPPGTNNATTYDIWFASSHDHGQTFYGPFKISSGQGTSVFPWIDAGDDGRVDVVWYQSPNPAPPLVSDPSTPATLTGGPNQMPAGSTWTVVFAQSLNAASREPVFALTTASDHIIHTGSISIGGTFGNSDRSLLDYFKVAIGPDGVANIMNADNGTAGLHINYIRQSGGPLALTNPTFPTCLGNVVPLTTVVSRKMHGTAGTFDINLPLTGTRGVECRTAGHLPNGANGDYQLVFKFPNLLTSVGGATVSAHDPSNGTGSVDSSMIDPNDAHQYIVNLSNVSNAQYLTVTLTNVVDSTGNAADVVSPQFGVLIGDVNASGREDSTDVTIVRSQTVQIPTQDSCRYDVNASGRTDATDVTVTRSLTVSALPSNP